MEIENTDKGPVELWTPQEVADALGRQEIVLIDVRTPAEFAFERIGGALLSPMQSFDPDHLPGQSDRRMVLHCGSGIRSGKMAGKCLGAGIDKIAHMKGGLGAWKEAGLPYIGTNMQTGAPQEMKKPG